MKFGACVGMDTDKLAVIKAAGYDYAETSSSAIQAASQEDFEAFCTAAKQLDMPVEAANNFVPGRIALVGESRATAAITDYLNSLMPRAAKLGVKTIVFGSGGARHIPDGMDKQEGQKYLIDFLRSFAGPIAAKHGVSIAIEPLRSKEDNAINTVHEGVEIVKQVNLPNVKVLADLYHMACESEDFEYLCSLDSMLLHTHTSTPVGGEKRRRFMLPDDGYDQLPFLAAVSATQCPRCSVEASTDDFAHDAPLSLKVIKDALARL